MRVKRIFLIACILILAACSSKPEIEGTVKDYFGSPVEGVQVSIENSAFTAITDADGKYQIEYMPGTFTVVFTKDGYSTRKMKLNLATKDKFPAEDTVLIKLPDGHGVYFYGKEKIVRLSPNKLSMAGTMMESRTGIKELSGNLTTSSRPTLIIYGNQYPADSLMLNRLTFTKKAKVRGVFGKSNRDINMWTAAEKIDFKIPLYPARKNSDNRPLPFSPLKIAKSNLPGSRKKFKIPFIQKNENPGKLPFITLKHSFLVKFMALEKFSLPLLSFSILSTYERANLSP